MFDIVLVEDNPADVELALEALGENNLACRVKVLRDGQDAVDYIFRTGRYRNCCSLENPKLILLDLNLPKIDGLEILKRIRSDEHTKKIQVAIFTSSLDHNDRIESYKLGVDKYIVKPVGFDSFARECITMSLEVIARSEALTR